MAFFKIFAFVKKSFLIQWSYRLAVCLSIVSSFATLLVFYFVDGLFGYRVVPHLAPYGVNYFSYALLGIALSGFLGTSLGRVAHQINQEQAVGTLEALLVTPTSMWTLIGAMITWDLLYAFVEFAVYIMAGIFLFGIDFSNINITAASVIAALSLISFNSLSIISAGFIIVLKKGDPVSWLFSTGFELLGGVYFPVSVLPDWLETVSYLFPITYCIRAMELAVYRGFGLRQLYADVFVLGLFSLLLLPVAIYVMKHALNRAKRDGSLVEY